MSDEAAESKPPVDLSQLRLMPNWVSDFGKAQPRLESDETDSRPRDRERRDGGGGGYRDGGFRGDRRGAPPPRRDGGSGGGGGRPPFGRQEGGGGPGGAGGFVRRDDRGRGPGAGGPQGRGGPPGDRRGGGDRRDDRGGAGGGRFRRDDRGPREHGQGYGPRFEMPPQIPGLNAKIEADPQSMEAMVSMIRAAGKAYSVFDAARLVLASGDRFHVKFFLPADSPTKLVHVPVDGSLWLSREDAISHLLRSDTLDHFYRAEQVELEEPKGNFASVAVCGMTGELLGPPNHHSYQATLHKIHRERFSDMPFDEYKRRVRTDSSPEAVAKWKESQKHGTQWVDIVTPPPEGGEPTRLKSRADMETHFRRQFADPLLKESHEASVAGNIFKKNLAPSLYFALRQAVDDARKHLLQTAQQLCSGFEHSGLKLFKRRGGKLWVSRNRPRALDGHVVLSDRIAKIVDVVRAHSGIHVKQLLEVVAPTPAPAPAPAAAEKSEASAAPETAPAEAHVKVASVEGQAPTAPVEIPEPATAEAAHITPVDEVAPAEEAAPATEQTAPVAAEAEPAAEEVAPEASEEIPADETAAPAAEAEAPALEEASAEQESPSVEAATELPPAAETEAPAEASAPEAAPAPAAQPAKGEGRGPQQQRRGDGKQQQRGNKPAGLGNEGPALQPQELTTQQLQVLKDLHWLNSEGYVIEYADGVVFIGVTEPPPPKPKAPKEVAPKAESAPKAEAAAEAVTTEAPAEAEAEAEVAEAHAEASPASAEESAPAPASEVHHSEEAKAEAVTVEPAKEPAAAAHAESHEEHHAHEVAAEPAHVGES